MTDETNDDADDRTDTESAERTKPRSTRSQPPEDANSGDSQSNASSKTGSKRTRRGTSRASSTERSPTEYVYWGGLVICSILAVVALFNFYSNATQAISTWVESEYEPIVQSAFALVVLLAALVGVSLTVRKLSPSRFE